MLVDRVQANITFQMHKRFTPSSGNSCDSNSSAVGKNDLRGRNDIVAILSPVVLFQEFRLPPQVAHPFGFPAKGWDCGAPSNFHSPTVTSDLASKIKSRNHGRGRDGWQRPIRYALKSFVV